jgi:hypothetical protein
VIEEIRQEPLVTEVTLCVRGASRLERIDLTTDNIYTTLEQVPCTVIRPPLRQQWEVGRIHPKEQVMLEEALITDRALATCVERHRVSLGSWPGGRPVSDHSDLDCPAGPGSQGRHG